MIVSGKECKIDPNSDDVLFYGQLQTVTIETQMENGE